MARGDYRNTSLSSILALKDITRISQASIRSSAISPRRSNPELSRIESLIFQSRPGSLVRWGEFPFLQK